jgi:hypothetical protein
MFERDPKDLTATLSWMESTARERSKFNQIEAKQRMAEFIANDRRFDAYDTAKLVDRVSHCKSYGAKLDLEDPALLKGGKPRPLSR